VAEFTYPQFQGIGEDYERDGFVIVRNVLSAGLIREADRHIAWLMDRHPDLPPESLGHWLIACDPFWVRFLSDRNLLDVAEALVGPNVALSFPVPRQSRRRNQHLPEVSRVRGREAHDVSRLRGLVVSNCSTQNRSQNSRSGEKRHQ